MRGGRSSRQSVPYLQSGGREREGLKVSAWEM